MTWNSDCSKESKHRIAKATSAFKEFRKIWNSKEIRISTKMSLLSSVNM